MYTINLHILPSGFKHQSRILKETKSLAENGLFDKIFIVALWEDGLKKHENLDAKREVWGVPLKTGGLPKGSFRRALKIIEWTLRIFLRFRKERIRVVHCHGLATLPIGMLFKIFIKSKVIYDAHDLETERTEWHRTRKMIAKLLERSLIHRSDAIIVVSDSIAQWYKNQYGLEEIYIIKNIPYRQNDRDNHSNILKEKFDIRDDEILYIYQGGLVNGRGIGILLNVFSKVDKKKHIAFMGYGILEQTIKNYESRFSNIHFQPAVSLEEVKSYTGSADVGISLIENTCLSYFYCLPNKLFEYILSGLPVLVSDFPDMGKLVEENNCGWKVLPDEKSVMGLIESISKEDIKEKKINVLNCRHNFSWETEEKKMLEAYRNLLAQ